MNSRYAIVKSNLCIGVLTNSELDFPTQSAFLADISKANNFEFFIPFFEINVGSESSISKFMDFPNISSASAQLNSRNLIASIDQGCGLPPCLYPYFVSDVDGAFYLQVVCGLIVKCLLLFGMDLPLVSQA